VSKTCLKDVREARACKGSQGTQQLEGLGSATDDGCCEGCS
jgi:hypothetical protein